MCPELRWSLSLSHSRTFLVREGLVASALHQRMDQWKPVEGFFQGTPAAGVASNVLQRDGDLCVSSGRLQPSCPDSSQRVEQESKGSLNARKVQKADREKLRRDRLNEQFVELGNALDPDRPKNDKAAILADAIQVLKDMTSQVDKLKAEHTSLSEESRELTQEKNELREEKTALKSEIDNLNVQHQQRLRCMYPWATVDPSVAMGSLPPYTFPMPVPVPAGQMPFHASIQPYPFFQNLNPPSYLSYSSHCNPYVEHQSTHCLTPQSDPSINRHQSTKQKNTRNPQSLDRQQGSGLERSSDFSDVATELELKMPGSSAPSNAKPSANEQESSSVRGKVGQLPQLQGKGSNNGDKTSSSRCSSNSNGGGSVANS